MSNDFPLYTTDYISGVMSLRKPQTQSLKILEEITNAVQLRKGMNLKAALGAVHAMYPICSDFERDFMSLTFALATEQPLSGLHQGHHGGRRVSDHRLPLF